MEGAGMTLSFFGFASVPRLGGSGLSTLPSQEPRTEYHPSLSRCSGRLLSRGCNLIGRPSSSWPTSEKLVRGIENPERVCSACLYDLNVKKKSKPALTSFRCNRNLM